jgi:hypothetical protein
MALRRLSLVLVAGALFFLQFADCMSAMTPDENSMQCCGSTPCTPANQSHDCCKGMGSGQSSNLLPTARVAVHVLAIALTEPLATREIARVFSGPFNIVEVQQHSPPELYTLHASLLI